MAAVHAVGLMSEIKISLLNKPLKILLFDQCEAELSFKI